MLDGPSNSRGRGSRVPSINSRRNVSTMNRPDSDSLNANASATVAAQVFKKMQTEERDGCKPAIANGFIPPVVNDLGAPKTEVKNSPFKAAAKSPIKRPKGVTNAAMKSDDEPKPENSNAGSEAGPQIAKFMPIPVIEEPKSPFAPIQKKSEPIKRPSSASVNHAQVAAQEEELERLQAELDALGGISRTPESTAPKAPSAPLKTKDKTFVPLAPVPYFKQDEEKINPFAAPVQKTEEQIRKEEEAARRALENSRVDKKKSKLDKIMDGLNRPIF